MVTLITNGGFKLQAINSRISLLQKGLQVDYGQSYFILSISMLGVPLYLILNADILNFSVIYTVIYKWYNTLIT